MNYPTQDYVLQRALTVAEGDQLDDLMAKIRPQLINLRRYSNNYAKHLAASESFGSVNLAIGSADESW